MPKKFQGENSKAVIARARKADEQAEKKAAAEKAKEDAYWQDDDRSIAKKNQRRDEKERKRQEELDRKKELKELHDNEMEAVAMASASAATKPGTSSKVTQAQLDKRRQAEMEHRQEQDRLRLLAQQKLVVAEENGGVTENVNRLVVDGAQASNIDEAIAVLTTAGASTEPAVDAHPEKRMKASYLEYEERRIPELKREHPTFRLSQLKQILKKEWQKSPENPLNQRLQSIIGD